MSKVASEVVGGVLNELHLAIKSMTLKKRKVSLSKRKLPSMRWRRIKMC